MQVCSLQSCLCCCGCVDVVVFVVEASVQMCSLLSCLVRLCCCGCVDVVVLVVEAKVCSYDLLL